MNSAIAAPAAVGATASALSYVLSNGAQTIGTPLGNMPAWVPVGVSIGAASYAANMLKDRVVPADNTNQIIATLAKPAITGAAGIAALYATTGGNMDGQAIQGAFILGAGSELLGSYVYEKAVSRYVM